MELRSVPDSHGSHRVLCCVYILCVGRELLNGTIVPLDIYNDEQMEQLMAVLRLEIDDPNIEQFIEFLDDLEFDDLNQTVEFNLTDPDAIAELLEFVSYSNLHILLFLSCYLRIANAIITVKKCKDILRCFVCDVICSILQCTGPKHYSL